MTLFDLPLIGIDELLTQQAQVQRNEATEDGLHRRSGTDWQNHGDPVPCFMWWGTGSVATRIGAKHVQPQETVDLDTGGMVMPEGTDITARDRISQVVDEDGHPLISSVLEILAAAPFAGLTEVTFRRIS